MATAALNLDRLSALAELERQDCEQSLYHFLSRAWAYIDAARWRDGWPIEAVAEHLQAVVDGEIPNLVINIPPRFGKSSICSVALPAWTWCQPTQTPTSGPGVQFLYASYGLHLSIRDSVKCRRLIESPWYRSHWGDRYRLTSDQNTKGRFTNSALGERLVTSIGATVTGEGGNIIVIDDPNAANEAFSEAKTQGTIDWWDGTMSSRLNDLSTGAYIVIQQRLAENDLTGHILSKDEGEWTHLCLPMHYEPARSVVTSIGWKDPREKEGELLWPERFPEEAVNKLARTMGPFIAAGQLEQRPERKGGGIIKRDWWQTWEQAAYPGMDFTMASLDTAFTEKQENDPSAMTCWGVWTDDVVATAGRIIGIDGRPTFIDRTYDTGAPKVMLMSAWQDRLEFNDLIKKVAATCKRMKVNLLMIENKANGISVAQEIRRLYANENFSVILNDPRSEDKRARLYSVQHIFAEGMIWAPDKEWAEMVIQQCAVFPYGEHDDLVDTVSQALRHMRKMGMLTRSEERIEEIAQARRYQGKPPAPLYPA